MIFFVRKFKKNFVFGIFLLSCNELSKTSTTQTIKNINISKMENLVKKIKENIDLFVVNADAQLSKNNKAAGARARKAALELMKDLKEFRKVSVEEAKK